MITEVRITEQGVETFYSQHCPSGMSMQEWLEKVVQDVVLAPSNMRKLQVPGTTIEIDRRKVTSVTITQNAN